MDPEGEKKADLFADILEYREALALLHQYGIGFCVTIDRYWQGDEIIPYFKVAIAKLHPEKGKYRLWHAGAQGDSFLKAVQYAVKAAKLESASYFEKQREAEKWAVKAATDVPLRASHSVWPGVVEATLVEEWKKAGLLPGVPARPAEEGS